MTLLRLATLGTVLGLLGAGPAAAGITKIELTPTDVGSGNSSIFTTLPTADPALFGLTGGDVRKVNFDTTPGGVAIPSGSSMTNQYASLGVLMNGFSVSNSVFGGAASPPNATTTSFTTGVDLIFSFTVPVVAVGAINTSPDKDGVEFWSGQNGTGTLLFSFIDQDGLALNFNVDRFVGGRATDGDLIGSIVFTNAGGQIELDEFIFEVQATQPPTGIPEPATMGLLLLGLAGLGLARRSRG